MKFALLALMFSFTAFATDFSTFNGQTYKKTDLTQCLADFDLIQKNVDSVDGYRVLDGGCFEAGNLFLMKFNYAHPLANSFEVQTVKLSDAESCLKGATAVADEVKSSGNHFVTSYCVGTELTTTWIDLTYSLVRSLNRLGKFATPADCSNFLSQLTTKAKKFNLTSLMSYCQDNSPVFNYITAAGVEMALITGKACTQDAIATDAFAENKIKVVHAYCAAQENILYMVPNNEMRYITEFNGLIVATAEVCETQLASILKNFEVTGQKVLYGFCKKLDDKHFKASVTYIKHIE